MSDRIPEKEHSAEFSPLFKLSLGLLLVSLALTFNHGFAWSWLGDLGWLSVPLGIILAASVFYVPVVLVSHHCLRLASFYQLMAQLHQMTRHLAWWQIVVLSVLAGVGEELLFRGFIQSGLSGLVGGYTAIVLTSLIFGLLHAMTLYYFVFAFLLSLMFGALLAASQSMLLLVTLHAVYDVIALGMIVKYPEYLGLTVENDDGPD